MKDKTLKTLDVIGWTLMTIGGIIWGCVGFFNINPVVAVFGELAPFTRTVYILIGLAALYEVFGVHAIARRWDLHFRRRPVTA